MSDPVRAAHPTPTKSAWLVPMLLAGVGALLVALAMTAAREGIAYADLGYWTGLLLMFAPVAARLTSASATRGERVMLLVGLGLWLYLVKILHSPTALTFYDELLHWRTASDIMATGHLFGENPLLPVSPYYPGLESATLVLAQFVGLPLYESAILMLATARILGVLALFIFYEQVTRSHRLAGLATLIYVANPAFVYFDQQFAYESLGLPLTLFLLWIEARRQSEAGPARYAFAGLAGLILPVIIVTHHLSSYMLSAFLVLWSLVWLWLRRSNRASRSSPLWLAGAAILGIGTWLFLVARGTIPYLGGNLLVTLREVISLITRETTLRRLFHGFGGDVAPLWEQLVSYGAVIGVMAVLPLGLLAVWGRYRNHSLALTLGLGALAYPVTQVLRFTPFGLQVAGRTPEFIFLPLGFVLAAAWLHLGLARTGRPNVPLGRLGSLLADWGGAILSRRALFTVWITVLFVGGVILGWPRWGRMPGPYLVVADSRSIESQGLTVAQWARERIEPRERIAADRVNALLLLAYGRLDPVTASYDYVNVPELFFAPALGPGQRNIIREGEIRYIVFDRRLVTDIPAAGFYFEPGDRPPEEIVLPVGVPLREDLEVQPDVHRIMDSGDIIIYDVGAIRDGR